MKNKMPLYPIAMTMLLLISLALSCPVLHAATYLNQTRLIINEQVRETSFDVINEGETSALIQIWSDNSNLFDSPESIKMPFLIFPPVFRLDGKKSRAIKIQLIGKPSQLPNDKESLFWLNVLEIPPKAASTDNSTRLQMAFRTRIKLFYRPEAIAKAKPEEGVKALTASTVHCQQGQCVQLRSTSPLHITLISITFSNGDVISDLPQDGIIAPFSTLDIPRPASSGPNALAIKEMLWVDDFGVINKLTK